MSLCLCYHDEQNFLHERGVCYGTKEKELCSCGGNPAMCDFYEEIREKYIHRTKADRIRSMTDKELAMFLCHSSACSCCVAKTLCNNNTIGWLKWLQQENNNII